MCIRDRIKYILLLALLPLLLVVAALQLRYFLGLKADVITSCCGSLFSEDAKGLAGDAAAAPLLPTMIAFYAALALAAGAGFYYRLRQRGAYFVALFSVLAFIVAMAGILSFVSLYIYEHPHHHCPFCVLKPEYEYQGYWLYPVSYTHLSMPRNGGEATIQPATSPRVGEKSSRRIVASPPLRGMLRASSP